MTQTILNGGSALTQDDYTGPKNELTVDESNGNLRLHDGVTPGGAEIPRRDNLDARYQIRSAELDGFALFEPQEVGFLTRVGPANYRLRHLSVDSASLALQNPAGYLGNPLLALAATLTSEHTWTGQQVFQAVVEFSAGINGNVAGDLLGNVVGNVTGNVTGNLTGNANGLHSGGFTGDVDTRGSGLLLDDAQIAPAKIAGLPDFIKLHAVPAGVILMWAGLEEDVPVGWSICNGLNSTPDLRNRFIVGAGTGGDYEEGQTGGFDSVTPVVTINEGGLHTHALSGNTQSALAGVTVAGAASPSAAWDTGGGSGQPLLSVSRVDPGHVHGQGGQADSNGAHTHSNTVAAVDNRPRYFALCYIMKD